MFLNQLQVFIIFGLLYIFDRLIVSPVKDRKQRNKTVCEMNAYEAFTNDIQGKGAAKLPVQKFFS